MPFRKLPKSAQFYILLNVILSAVLFAGVLKATGIHFDATLAFLGGLSILTNVPKVRLTVDTGRMTLSNTIIFLTIMLHRNLGEVVSIAALSALAGTVLIKPSPRPDGSPGKRTWYRPALSCANLVISGYVAGLLWRLSWSGDLRHIISVQFIVALVLMSGSYFLVNTFGISFAVALSQKLNVYTVWHENFLWTFAGYLCAVSASACVSILYYRVVWTSIYQQFWFVGVLLLPPIYIVYISYKIYLDKIQRELAHIHELNELNSRVISTLAMTIEAKDRYTHKHVERVREYALAIANELGVIGPELDAVRIGSMVHDIGKIAVPEMILTKPGKLTPEEHSRMKSHVLVGVKILEAVNFPFPVTDAVSAHHERWDGNGYPYGMKGEEIPLVGRIVALADGYDALTSDRHYRKAMADQEALEYIQSERGTHYDPKVVDALVSSLPKVKPVIDGLNSQQWLTDDLMGHRRMIPQEALEEIARAAEEAVFLAEMSLKPDSMHGPQQVIDLLLEKASLLLPSTAGAVFLLDDEKQEITVAACRGLHNYLLVDLTMKVGEGVSGWVAGNGQASVNEPAANDLARRLTPGKNLELNSALSVPLQIGDSMLGVITLYHAGYNIFNSHHLRLLTILADHASSGLDTLFRLEKNQALAYTDSLTDLPNMRFLIQHLEKLTSEKDRPFSIFLLDLNGFKLINDSFGHLEGDRVLKDVAQKILKNCTRADDLVGRYAGDEFLIICGGHREEDARRITERIRHGFASYQPFSNDEFLLSASIGTAIFPIDGSDWSSLLSVADQRMYRDKLNYHNQDEAHSYENKLPSRAIGT